MSQLFIDIYSDAYRCFYARFYGNSSCRTFGGDCQYLIWRFYPQKKVMRKICIALGLSIILFGMFENVWAYFEDRFYCYIKDTSIIISLHQDNGYQKCITLSKSIDEKIYQADDGIAKADKLIQNKEDVPYWIEVKETLNKQKSSLQYVSIQLNLSIDNFEKSLFVKIQKLLSYYLTKERNLITVKINKTNENLSDNRKNGNLVSFEENIKILDDLMVKKIFLRLYLMLKVLMKWYLFWNII